LQVASIILGKDLSKLPAFSSWIDSYLFTPKKKIEQIKNNAE